MTTRTYRALLVANSTFPSDAHNLPELEGPRNDPVLLREALCHDEVGLFPADNVRLVTERTMAEVLGETEDFLRSATRQDTLLLYYSGHGMLDQSGELFLCTRDSRTDRLRSTAVKATDLRAMMDESAAAATVVVLDCCHSGRFKGGDIPSALSGRGRFVVTSSRSGGLANDAHVRNHASLFTHHLAEGLLHGAQDHDDDGVITLSELYDYVHTALVREGRQVPQKRFEGDGDVAVALRGGSSASASGSGAARRSQADLVAPASAAPELDLSEAAIDLGEVDADEDLPPERVAVINRGGGTLEWTAESSASWVEAVPEEGAVVLHLHPVPGPNRANVYVRDSQTGALRTLRISVRIRPERADASAAPWPAAKSAATSPPAVSESVDTGTATAEEPAPDAPPVADTEALTEPAPPETPASGTPTTTPRSVAEELAPGAPPVAEAAIAGASPRPDGHNGRDIPVAFLAVAAASIVAGIVMVATANQIIQLAIDNAGWDVSLRGKEWGNGLQSGLLGGIALVAAGVVALVPMLRLPLAAACLGIAGPLAFVRLSELAATSDTDPSVADRYPWYNASWVFALGVAAVGAFALARAGAWRRTSWAPRALVGSTVGVALAWSLSLLVDVYQLHGVSYGSAFTSDGTAAGIWRMIAAVAVAALAYCGLRWLSPNTGAALVVGAAVTPFLAVVNECSYLAAGVEDPAKVDGLLVMVIPALATIGLGIAAAVLASRAGEGEASG